MTSGRERVEQLQAQADQAKTQALRDEVDGWLASDPPAGFQKPFTLYTGGIYIRDANGNNACDFVDFSALKPFHASVRPRGWGRIHLTILRAGRDMDYANQVMDAWINWVNDRAGGLTDKKEVVRRLNEES